MTRAYRLYASEAVHFFRFKVQLTDCTTLALSATSSFTLQYAIYMMCFPANLLF